MIFARSLLALVLIVASPSLSGANDRGRWKAEKLAPADQQAWIAALKAHRTRDGSTVLETLRFAEQMRPRAFKIGTFDVGYNGATGAADSVGVGYFIGLKRATTDEFSAYFRVRRADGKISLSLANNHSGIQTAAEAIESGRDGLLHFIDEEYKFNCLDGQSRRPLC